MRKTLSPSICPFRRTEIIVLPVSFLTQQAGAATMESVSPTEDSAGFLRNVQEHDFRPLQFSPKRSKLRCFEVKDKYLILKYNLHVCCSGCSSAILTRDFFVLVRRFNSLKLFVHLNFSPFFFSPHCDKLF